jgi:xylulokinase
MNVSHLLGIDLGTQSAKAMIIDGRGNAAGLGTESYEFTIPRPGWAEQRPDTWYDAAASAIRRAVDSSGVSADAIDAVSFSGQMHGLVCVGEDGRPLRDAILWLDQRARSAIDGIYEKLGADFITSNVQNKISAGFLIGSLYWIYLNEPEIYRRIKRVMLPKDYVKFRLTGRAVTDYSDAAGSAAFDNVKLRWAVPLINGLGLDAGIFPEALPSSEAVGAVTEAAARDTSLRAGTKVVNGGGDQFMQSTGNGITDEGMYACNIGTAGQVSACSSRPVYDPLLRTNTFAHAIPGRWNVMGACLTSGVSLKWFARSILGMESFADVDAEVAKLKPGSGGLIFLPYLSGERTPHLDAEARGLFCGLTLGHGKFHMARAVMEGVTYSLRDCMELLVGMGVPCDRIVASGGGANSEVWMQMQADILGREVCKSKVSEQACMGAAITAGVGADIYKNYQDACRELVKFEDRTFSPSDKNSEIYAEYFGAFQKLYRDNRENFARLGALSEIGM